MRGPVYCHGRKIFDEGGYAVFPPIPEPGQPSTPRRFESALPSPEQLARWAAEDEYDTESTLPERVRRRLALAPKGPSA